MNARKNIVISLAAFSILNACVVRGDDVGTAFTYQGELLLNGVPVIGDCDFQFSLWDDPLAGSQVGPTLTMTASLGNGRFTVRLDFGDDRFTGRPRWLEIKVCHPSPCNNYTTLAPRQELTPAPYALALPALRTTPSGGSPDSANVIAGHHQNRVPSFIGGATISGGGDTGDPNEALASFATVGGGVGNTAGGSNATVGGGRENRANGTSSAIGGGERNSAAQYATVAGGRDNAASRFDSTVAGGIRNTASGPNAAVGGGGDNVAGSGAYATVPGGFGNEATGIYSLAAGRQAKANHAGTFVWADNTNADFASSGANQFLIRAGGGVGINTNSPGAALHVGGIAGVDGIMFPDGSFQTTAGGGGGGNTLDRAYDQGGPGAGRVITADGGAVRIAGPDGLTVAGRVGVGTTNPLAKLHIAGTPGVDGIRFPDGTMQTSAATAGAGNTLDQAYDQGGPGGGRTITANAGPARIAGPDGLTADGTLTLNGTVNINTDNIRINADGPDADDATVFFRNNNSPTGESLRFDDSDDRFEFSDALAVSGPIRVGSRSDTPTAYSHFGSFGSSPTTGVINSIADVFVEDDLEVGGDSFVGANNFVSADLFVDDRVWVGASCNDTGFAQFSGTISTNALIFHIAGERNNGWMAVYDSSSNSQAGMYVDDPTGLGIVFADIKNFRMTNPADPDTEIWYACIEGPEAAAYIRGTGQLVDGRAVIEFPEHFKNVAAEDGMTVQLTALSTESTGLGVSSKKLAGVVVEELNGGTGTYDFDYLVMAVRAGYEGYRVIRDADEAQAGFPSEERPDASETEEEDVEPIPAASAGLASHARDEQRIGSVAAPNKEIDARPMDLKRQIAELRAENADLASRVARLGASIAAQKDAELDVLRNKNAEMEARLTRLEGMLASANGGAQ